MIFNSYAFVFLMMPLSIAGYYILNRINIKYGLIWLLSVSLFFVGYMNVGYLAVLIPSICFNYVISYLMNSNGPKTKNASLNRKRLLTVGIILNVAVLIFFKYTDFLIDNVNEIFAKDYSLLHLILPLGISFYTFQQISCLVDHYRDKDLHIGFLEYAVYISFYPQFVQGPIVLQEEFIPQLRDSSRKNFDLQYAFKGLCRFTLGLAKKVLIADGIALIVDGGYQGLDEIGALSALVLIFSYSLQIYFDFSGYSDMAVGLGLLFHIDLPENFDSPYKAVSINDFWDRWHITLTRFFTRYIYIPLGGNRKGKGRTYANIFILFLISGIWHGAEWSFVIWGLLHGIATIVHRMISDRNKKHSLHNITSRTITFCYVSVAWVFFRADKTADALCVFKKLAEGGWNGITVRMYEAFSKLVEVSWLLRLDVLEIRNRFQGLAAILIMILLIIVCFVAPGSKEMTDRCVKKITCQRLLVISVLLFWSILSFSGVNNYIYWNF